MSTITLPNIRVSSDLTVKVRLKDDGVAIDWSTLSNIRALIYSDAQRAMAGRCVVTVDAEDSTLLVCQYAANKPQYIGVNRIVISATYMNEMKTYDKPALNFVRWTDDQSGEQITIDDPDVEVEIEVQDVSSSILDAAIAAAITAAVRADEAAAAAEHMTDIHQGPPGEDGKSPYIGENGHWYEWDEDAGEYVDTETEAQGETGTTPDITIGTVTTAEPGTPAAATMTGTPEAPVLNLTIPKGVAGDTPAFTVGEVTTGQPGTPVVVTITGTAAAPVLNVTIPQGMQGNTGSSVEYPYELVNNLTTNDATKGLSAAQGVVLDGKITQLEHKTGELSILDNGTQKKAVYVGSDTSIGQVGDIIDVTSTNAFAVELNIPAGAYEVYFYFRKWTSGDWGYAFLDGNGTVLDSAKATSSANVTLTIPTGATKFRTTLYSSNRTIKFNTSESIKTAINRNEDNIGFSEGIGDARLVIRSATGSQDTTDNPSGTRLRIVLQVSAGMKLWAKTTDIGGLYVGVWDSLKNAVLSTTTGRLQSAVGYTLDAVDYDITQTGFLGISLTNGSTAITDARKAEMLASLSFCLGVGLEFENARLKYISSDNEEELSAIRNPGRSNAYYGEKINVGGGFDWYVYSNSAAGGQSSARFGDYLFIVLDELTKVKCFNLKTRSLLCEVSPGLTPADTWHCNQTSFSTKFYDAGDMFPVMYVSMRNDAEGKCSALGFRITPTITNGEISAFTITLVQTIKFPAMTDENCLGNVNATFDTQNGFLWGYSRNNNSSAENYNQARFTKFAIPELSQSLVELTDADILDAFSDDWSMFNAQGGFIGNGKLVMMQGYPSAGYIWCRVIDLYLAKKQTSLIDLYKAGVSYEPEGCFIYDGKIMTSTSDATIVAIEFD